MMRRPSRFLFFSHDGLGLGHVRRNLTVARALVDLDPDASILIATSTEEAERFGLPPRVDFLKLPGLRKLDNEHYAARRLPVPWGQIRAVRAKLLAAAVESFRPDVLLADKHPFGVGSELEPALEDARTTGTRTVLGLRDVLDDASAVHREWQVRGVFERIGEYYDRVLVYGQQDVIDPRREYGFPDQVAAMTHFCGYVVSQTATSSATNGALAALPRRRGDRPRVLATAGGGEDGMALLSTFVKAASTAGWEAGVVSGPQCARAPALRELAVNAGVSFRRFVPGLAAEFPSLDALVCMGGYNTLTEAAASGVRTVCVPRVKPRREQLIRADAFARRGLVRLLEPDRLNPNALGAEVESALEEPPPNGNGAGGGLDFEGALRAARALVELAADAEVAEPAGVRGE
jgi:predicted glycosyltransferase